MGDSRRRAKRFTADARYLVFPRARDHAGDRAGDGRDRLRVETDAGTWFSAHGAALAATDPDFYSYLDLRLLQGRELTVTITGPHAAAIELVRVSDEIPGRYPPYAEPGRPQVHFSALRGWLNDPSGMFYLDGAWHLYYANNRFANRMAGPNNAWAHAVSSDLLHWEELPLLLAPQRGRHSFWTGGAAVDLANATGLGSAQRPAVVFAANNGSDAPNAFTQCTFVSVDGGLTCHSDRRMMYHPLPAQAERRGGGTRDPMILWWEPEQKWVMVVYNRPPGGEHSFFFFESKDLRSWRETGVLAGMYECPNLFRLPVDGDPNRQRWVVWGSSTEYLIGDFDGQRFVADTGQRLRTHHGAFSASQVFANAPAGRIVQIGWAHCCNYAHEFCQMASFPLQLSLRTTAAGVHLFAQFIPELRRLRLGGWEKEGVTVGAGTSYRTGDSSGPLEMLLEATATPGATLVVSGSELELTWHAASGNFRLQGERVTIPDPVPDGQISLHLLLDIPSVEAVVNDGACYVIQGRDYRRLDPAVPLRIAARGGEITLHRVQVYPLRSIHGNA